MRPTSHPRSFAPFVALCMASFGACAVPVKSAMPAPPVAAPKPPPPIESVADPAFLKAYAATYRYRLGHPRAIKITPDGKTVLFLRSGPRSFVQDLYAFDVTTGKERVLLTAARILKGAAEHLSAAEKARRERMRQTARGLASYQLSKDGKRLLVPLSGRLYAIEMASSKVRELKTPAPGFALDPQLSPDGGRVSYVKNGDLYVYAFKTGKERRLTRRASADIEHGAAEFVAQEEMRRRHGNWWSPEGKRLLYQRTDNSGVERLHIMWPDRPAKKPQASPYPRPGKKNAVVTLGLIAARGGRTTWLKWDAARWPYVVRAVWADHGPLTVLVQNRKQTEIAILAVDDVKGGTRVLHVEKDAAWVNIDARMPRWLPSGEFLWTTERAGSWQLEVRGADGAFVRSLTKPELGYRKLIGVNAKDKKVWLVASAEPTESHVWSVPLAGGKATRLTREPGQHGAVWQAKADVGVLLSDTIKGGRSATVLGADGKPAGKLKTVAEKPARKPNVSFLTVGSKAFATQVFKPRNFIAGRKYPVIVYVYGGPHWAVVNKSSSRLALRQWIADHGYLVVSFDGRGTPNRGRAWERAIKGDFIGAPMADQVAALKALAAKVPEVDMGRVGIFGWSFGGYFSAMAAMRRPDVYHCAVAGAPVADWRDYDTHYTERYMGLPADNPKGYADSSVLTWAPKLGSELLIIHGTADDNVYFTHAIRMSDALFRAGKRHDFLPLTGFTHMVADPKVLASLYGRILGHFSGCLARRR